MGRLRRGCALLDLRAEEARAPLAGPCIDGDGSAVEILLPPGPSAAERGLSVADIVFDTPELSLALGPASVVVELGAT